MSNHLTMLRSNLLRLTVVLSLWLRAFHGVLAKSFFIDDNNSAVIYQPAAFWFTESQSCPREACLIPGNGATYHEAIHPPLVDPDDLPTSSTSPPSNLEHTSSSTHSVPTPTLIPDGKHDPGNDGDGDDDDDKRKGRKKRSRRSRFWQPRADIDPKTDITLSFNFTGTGISVFGIQPLGIASDDSDAPPTNTNLTFVLDSLSSTNMSASRHGELSFARNSSVFSRSNLDDGPHQLVIHVGLNSSFLFDYLVYEASNSTSTAPSSSPSTSTTPLAQTEPSQTSDPNRKRNIATFAGAVGGSVGVLAIFSLGLAISIIRRRRLAAMRDRLDRESLHTDASDDSPHPMHMSGPPPFVPRFFPDTVIPQDPPTYTTAVATNHNTSTLLASLNLEEILDRDSQSRNRSYADMPPSTPPPPLDEMIPPPPPFPVALNAPRNAPPGLVPVSVMHGGPATSTVVVDPELQNLVSSSTLNSNSSSSVGATTRSHSAVVAPELVPLLQPMTMPMPMGAGHVLPISTMRPLSRISTRSSYDIDGNPIEREDD